MTTNPLRAAYDSLVRPPLYLLAGSEDQLGQANPRPFAYAWIMLMPLAGVWGGVICLTWWVLDAIFGPGTYVAPLLTAVVALWPLRRALLAASERDSRRSPARNMIVPLLVFVIGFVAIRNHMQFPYDAESLPQWLLPYDRAYRVLLVMPLWGAWAMLILPKLCQPGKEPHPAVTTFGRGCPVSAAAMLMAVPLGLSLLFFNYLGWLQLIIVGAALVTAMGVGPLLAWRRGGLGREVMLATNVYVQVAVLLGFLAANKLIVHPLY